MEHDFWHSKWQKDETAFHEPEGNVFLIKHADVLLESAQPRIFVPLCGKTRDIHWLLSKGCHVVGAELSEIAIEQLFEDLKLTPTITAIGELKLYHNGALSIFVGDIFKVTQTLLGKVSGVYDRAALVALPDPLRKDYAAHLSQITQCAPMLLISFDYDQHIIPGPPFSVPLDTITSLYSTRYHIKLLEQAELEGGLKGKVAADTIVCTLTPRH